MGAGMSSAASDSSASEPHWTRDVPPEEESPAHDDKGEVNQGWFVGEDAERGEVVAEGVRPGTTPQAGPQPDPLQDPSDAASGVAARGVLDSGSDLSNVDADSSSDESCFDTKQSLRLAMAAARKAQVPYEERLRQRGVVEK